MAALRAAAAEGGVMQAALARTLRQDSAAQQGRAGIEAAGGIPDHPAALPGAGIARLALLANLQGHRAQFVPGADQLVAMPALQHQIADAVVIEIGRAHV